MKPFGERDLLGRVFTHDFGVLCGIFKAGQVAKQKPLIGQYGRASWSARLDSQLGALHFESEKNLIAALFAKPGRVKYANACFALLSALLPERERYEKLYAQTLRLFDAAGKDFDYLAWELILLSELGYGLAPDRCGNCGAAENLKYISPKSGRAICESCGAPFREKLFALPLSLEITKYFLSQIRELPPIRNLI